MIQYIFLDSDFSKESKLSIIFTERKNNSFTITKELELTNLIELPNIIIEASSYIKPAHKILGYNISYDIRTIKNRLDSMEASNLTMKNEVIKAKRSLFYRALGTSQEMSKFQVDSNVIDVYSSFTRYLVSDKELAAKYKEFCLKNGYLKGQILREDFVYKCKVSQSAVGAYYGTYSKDKQKLQQHEARQDTLDLINIFKKMESTKKVVEPSEDSVYKVISVSSQAALQYGYHKKATKHMEVLYKMEFFPPIRFGDDIPSKVKQAALNFYTTAIKGFNYKNYLNTKGLCDWSAIERDVSLSKTPIADITNAYNNYILALNVNIRKALAPTTTSTAVRRITPQEISDRESLINSLFSLAEHSSMQIKGMVKDVLPDYTSLFKTTKGRPLGILKSFKLAINKISVSDYDSACEDIVKTIKIDNIKAGLRKEQQIQLGLLSLISENKKDFMESLIDAYDPFDFDKLEMTLTDQEKAQVVKEVAKAIEQGMEHIRNTVKVLKQYSNSDVMKTHPKAGIGVVLATQSPTEAEFVRKRTLFLSSLYHDKKKRTANEEEKSKDIYVGRAFTIASVENAIIKRGRFKFKAIEQTSVDSLGQTVEAGIDGYFYSTDPKANGLFFYYHPSYREYNHLIIGFSRKHLKSQVPVYYTYKGFTAKQVLDFLMYMYLNDSIGYATWRVLRVQGFKAYDGDRKRGKGNYANIGSDPLTQITILKKFNQSAMSVSFIEDYRRHVLDDNQFTEALLS